MRIGNHEFDTKNETYIMGILNVTPDSFSDGGKFNHMDAAHLPFPGQFFHRQPERVCAWAGGILRALRVSFEIRRLRRLSRGSADPREL